MVGISRPRVHWIQTQADHRAADRIRTVDPVLAVGTRHEEVIPEPPRPGIWRPMTEPEHRGNVRCTAENL